MRKLYGYFLLTRPFNVLIAVFSIFIAAFICRALHMWDKVMWACVSGGFFIMAANAINDYFDIEIDRVNKPNRPLPAGLLTKNEAYVFSVICFALGIITSFNINLTAIFIAITSCVLLYAYSAKLKRTVVFGNFTVSFLSALAFIYGGIAVQRVQMVLIPAGFAFFMHFGREIIKDMEDVEGDKQQNAATLPVRFGFVPAQILVTAVFFILICATILPYLLKIYGKIYFIIVMLGVNTILMLTIYYVWKKPFRNILNRLSITLKVDMLVGLFAIYAGTW
ncbi:geranylgeranylglycerol-phosphate geranylgeranyltransferase [candidate division KSB1 bacterium]|nr:geranylgeranylglycerol-phosphate geranylgeranyltransferase [candidate division KSB1 bacterium]